MPKFYCEKCQKDFEIVDIKARIKDYIIMVSLLITFILGNCAICFSGDYDLQTIGDFDYVDGPEGYSGTGQQIGNFYYYNDNQGNRCVTQSIGNFDYTSGSRGYSGTGQQIGSFYHYNDNRGGSYSSQSIGSFDYTSGSGGYSGVGQQIGNFYYYGDNE